MNDEERNMWVDDLRSAIPDDCVDALKAFDVIIDDWDRLRKTEVKPPVPNFYTAVELADRAKELRERAAQYKGTENADIGEVYERDAAMLEYAAQLAAIRYDAKQAVGVLVYELYHSKTAEQALDVMAARVKKVWDTLAYGDENK